MVPRRLHRDPAFLGGMAGGALALVALALVFVFWRALIASETEAARNGSGAYSLPTPGNPVFPGNVIKSADFNTTMTDLGTEMQDSLSRSGKGGMLAPLQLTNGTKLNPALTFTNNTSWGLYRAGAADVRFSCNNTDCTKWGPLGTDFPLSLTAETLTANGDGIQGTGNGSGRGVFGTGGATGGTGVAGTGGVGSGTGGVFNGGSTNGPGVVATGIGAGVGGQFTGGSGASGIVASGGGGSLQGAVITGSSPNGDGTQSTGVGNGKGIWGIGGATGIGVVASAGTAATSGARQDGLQVTNGDINLDGVANVTSTVVMKNRVSPSNIVKAWGRVHGNGTPGVTNGAAFNVSSVTCGANQVVINFAQAFSNTSFIVLTDQPFGSGTMTLECTPTSSSAATCVVVNTASAAQNMCALADFYFIAMGNQ